VEQRQVNIVVFKQWDTKTGQKTWEEKW